MWSQPQGEVVTTSIHFRSVVYLISMLYILVIEDYPFVDDGLACGCASLLLFYSIMLLCHIVFADIF